jgi:hypothetical protein
VPAGERDDLVMEIRSHIADAIAAGSSTADVLERLGPADRLAKAYRAELVLQRGGSNWLVRVLAATGLVITTSIPSMIIIPLLAGLGLGFVAGGVAAVVVAIFPFAYTPFLRGARDHRPDAGRVDGGGPCDRRAARTVGAVLVRAAARRGVPPSAHRMNIAIIPTAILRKSQPNGRGTRQMPLLPWKELGAERGAARGAPGAPADSKSTPRSHPRIADAPQARLD